MQRLIACDTSFPPGIGYDTFADLIEPYLVAMAFECDRVQVPEPLWSAIGAHGPRTDLVARRRTGLPVCSMYFHVDTLPPGDGWTRPPLACTREGDTIYGRGTADMKGTIAAVLAALRAAFASNLSLTF